MTDKMAAKRERVLKEKARRERITRWDADYTPAGATEYSRWQDEQIALAQSGGYCLACLFQSGEREVEFVRHDGECPKGRAR